MNSCTRAIRHGSLVLALALVGLATGSTLLTTSAGASVRDFTPMTTINGVACASAHRCIGVGSVASDVNSGAAVSLDPVSGDLSTGQSLQLIGSSGLLEGVSCPSRSLCLAVGDNRNDTKGIAVPLNPQTAAVRSGQELHTISGIFIAGVACASGKECLAVGHDSSGSGVAVALQSSHRGHLERSEGADHCGDGWRRSGRSGLSLGEPLRGGRRERWAVGRGWRTVESGHRSDSSRAERAQRHPQGHPGRRGLSVVHGVSGGRLGCRPTVGGCTDRPEDGCATKGPKGSIHIGAGGHVDGGELSVHFVLPGGRKRRRRPLRRASGTDRSDDRQDCRRPKHSRRGWSRWCSSSSGVPLDNQMCCRRIRF